MLNYDQSFFLESYLNRSDLCSMRYSIELRPIFLDNRIYEFSKQISSNYKINISKESIIQKYLLKKISSKFYSRDFSFDKKKYFMSAPSDTFFKLKKTKKLFKKNINQKSKISKYYNIGKIINLLDEHIKGVKEHSNFLLRLLSLEIWLKSIK